MRRRKRLCGECTECCTHIKCDALAKPAGVACEHLRILPSPGCDIYDSRPHECKCFSCAWLDGLISKELRPDRCGFIIERCWLNVPDGTKLTMLVVVSGKPSTGHLDLLRQSARHRTIILGASFEMGSEEDLRLYHQWLNAVVLSGTFQGVDCDGTVYGEVCMSEGTTLHDDSLMPFGKWKGTRLGEVPDHYWRWFLQQSWSSEYPDLLDYAKLVEED